MTISTVPETLLKEKETQNPECVQNEVEGSYEIFPGASKGAPLAVTEKLPCSYILRYYANKEE